MRRALRLPRRPAATLAAVVAVPLVAAACGGDIKTENATDKAAAEVFNEHCSGCHSLDAANAYGSKPKGEVAGGERTNGPDFNVRKTSREDALFAIRNGGFSGAIMPANIVTGRQADEVAAFLAKYSGRNR